MPQNNKIKIRRGLNANLPAANTEIGELRYSTDSKELYIDDGSSNVKIGGNPTDFPISTATQSALNAKANASDTVNLTGNQTVAGVKTFSSSPVVPTATTNTQAVNKAQMDTADALKVNKAGDNITGQLASSLGTNMGYAQARGGNNISFGTSSGGNFVVYNATAPLELLNVMANGSGIRLGNSVGIGVPLIGTGFPQGVVSAPVGSIYIDTAVTNGASSWVKKSGTGNTGWSVLDGDVSITIPASDLLNGWDYENTSAAMRLARTGNIVTLTIPSIGLRGTSATASTFYTLPAGYRISSPGNYGTVGFVNAGGATAVHKDFNSLTCSARTNNVAGIMSWRTSESWPSA